MGITPIATITVTSIKMREGSKETVTSGHSSVVLGYSRVVGPRQSLLYCTGTAMAVRRRTAAY